MNVEWIIYDIDLALFELFQVYKNIKVFYVFKTMVTWSFQIFKNYTVMDTERRRGATIGHPEGSCQQCFIQITQIYKQRGFIEIGTMLSLGPLQMLKRL
ncbi:hypothetical protein ACJX0J_006949, partial [Zea mays]